MYTARRKASSVIYLPQFATSNAPSTRCGTRPGTKLAPWCTIHCSRREHSTEKNVLVAPLSVVFLREVPGTVVPSAC